MTHICLFKTIFHFYICTGLPSEDDNFYYDLFIREVEFENRNLIEISQMRKQFAVMEETITSMEKIQNEKLDEIIQLCKKENMPASSVKEEIFKLGESSWDDWVQLKRALVSFDAHSCQYVLLTDQLTRKDLEYYGIFSEICWKLVLDLDPDSDKDGLRSIANKANNRDGVIIDHTPASIKGWKQRIEDLLDQKRIHWVFVNGRNNDDTTGPPKVFLEWKRKSLAQIDRD